MHTTNDIHHDETHHQPGLMARLRAYFTSKDCIELGACLGFACIMLIPGWMNIDPRQRPMPVMPLASDSSVYIRNQMFNEIPKGETVSDTMLYLVAYIIPILLQIAMSLWKGLPGDVHATLCTYLVALPLVTAVTEFMKLYVGYFRPIFFHVCDPNEMYTKCMSDRGNEVRKSFLSGHASLSFGGLMLLSLFIHTRFGVPSVLRSFYYNAALTTTSTTATATVNDVEGAWTADEKMRHRVSQLRRARMFSMLSLVPFAVACFVAASRVVDNKHHPADVVGGAVLGASIAHFVHGLWFY
jgi:diacylglycerol diphosphate phosphatase / phosphatidate phosphatase